MSNRRLETWLTVLVVGIGVAITALAGLHTYVTATAVTLHPDPHAVPSIPGQAPRPAWSQAVERGREIARTGLAEQNLPGLSVAVGVGGEIVWAEGFGWADLEQQVPVGPELRFRIGTASKLLTSAAVGRLVDAGRLKLDDEIQTYVPEFPRKPWPVTVRQLMGHLAGIRNDGGDEGPLLTQRCDRPVDALPAFANRDLRFEPGTAFGYSNYGWILVSAAVEAAAHEPFLSVMQREVFDPLGLTHTTADVASDALPNHVTSYFPRYAADPTYGLHLMRPLDYSCYAGASVFVSTPSDLARFAMAMTRGSLLTPATVERLQSSQRLTSGAETGYGLGWDLERVSLGGSETTVVGYDGELLGGELASLVMLRDRDLVVAVFSNISYADTSSLALRIAEAFAATDKAVPAE